MRFVIQLLQHIWRWAERDRACWAVGCWLTAAVLGLASGVMAVDPVPKASADLPSAVFIETSRGVDSRVDYPSLIRFGPWDDRNYVLTLEDLALLSPNEATLDLPMPAFFRVVLRRELDLPTSGALQYPLSAPEIFRARFGGFQVAGRTVHRLQRLDGRLRLDLREPAGTAAEVGQPVETHRVSSPEGSSESAVAVRPGEPGRLIAASNGPDFSAVWTHLSTDGGVTWQRTELPLDVTSGDPTVDWSMDGSKAYVAALAGCEQPGGCELHVYRSGDGGATWTDFEMETPGDPRRELPQSADKEYLHVDTHPASPFADRVYLVWWAFSDGMQVARSADQGHFWQTLALPSAVGVGADLTTDRAGRLFLLWHDPNLRQVLVARSDDGGASFGAPQAVASNSASFRFELPAQAIRNVAMIVSADSDTTDGPFADSLYAAWPDTVDPPNAVGGAEENHGRVVVARSRDGGQTWQTTLPHDTADSDTVDRFNPWLQVDASGHVHLTFYSTLRHPDRLSVDLMRTVSVDGGVTWSTPRRLTAVASRSPGDAFQFGDYNGLAVLAGQAVATFSDNRNENGGSGDSVDIYAAAFSVGEPVFSDGFEGGDMSAWSSSVP